MKTEGPILVTSPGLAYFSLDIEWSNYGRILTVGSLDLAYIYVEHFFNTNQSLHIPKGKVTSVIN